MSAANVLGEVKLAGYHPCLLTDTSIPVAVKNMSVIHNIDMARPTN